MTPHKLLTWTPFWIRSAVMSSERWSLDRWKSNQKTRRLIGGWDQKVKGGQRSDRFCCSFCRSADQGLCDGTHCEQIDQYVWLIPFDRFNSWFNFEWLDAVWLICPEVDSHSVNTNERFVWRVAIFRRVRSVHVRFDDSSRSSRVQTFGCSLRQTCCSPVK